MQGINLRVSFVIRRQNDYIGVNNVMWFMGYHDGYGTPEDAISRRHTPMHQRIGWASNADHGRAATVTSTICDEV